MWRGRHVQRGRCHDCNEEEENYTRRNLRRLIHTVQRLPSNRSRLDTTSLWNLVGELETFSPPLSKRSVQSTHTDKKPYSKKYLNLRLYPSPGLSSTDNSPRRSKSNNRDSQHQDEISKPKNSALKNKSNQLHKTQPQKPKLDSNKNQYKTVLEKPFERKRNSIPGHLVKNKAPIKTIHARTNANITKAKTEKDNAYNKRNTRLKENNVKFKKSQTISKNKEVDGRCVDVSSNMHNEFKILDKVIELKRSEFKLESKRSTQLVVSACNHLITDQCSIVKQLTNYWNNLLNTDTDENNADSVSSVLRCCSSNSLEDPNEIASIQSFQNGIRISNAEIRHRHLSESNINILKRLESLNSCANNSTQILMSSSSNSLDLENNVVLGDNQRTMPGNEMMCWDTPFTGNDCKVATTTSEVCNTSSSNNSIIMGSNRIDVTTDSTVKVLKNILGQLILFPEQSILSEEIGLSQPVKTMLCLMTATLLTKPSGFDQEDHRKTDGREDSILLQDYETGNGKELEVRRSKTENNVWDANGDHLSNNTSNLIKVTSQCTTVAIPGITLKQVENALSTLALCKDFVWMRSILCEHFRDKNEDCVDFPSRSYTFIYEERVVLEEDDSGSDQEEQDYDGEYENKEFCPMIGSLSRFIHYISNAAEDAVDGVIEYIRPYLPNSIEGFVKMVYQVLVSILIWQVIAKEFISK